MILCGVVGQSAADSEGQVRGAEPLSGVPLAVSCAQLFPAPAGEAAPGPLPAPQLLPHWEHWEHWEQEGGVGLGAALWGCSALPQASSLGKHPACHLVLLKRSEKQLVRWGGGGRRCQEVPRVTVMVLGKKERVKKPLQKLE